MTPGPAGRWSAAGCLAVLAATVLLVLVGPARGQETTPVIGGGSFNDAPVVAPGRYVDSIRGGETLYYAVELDRGQVLTTGATLSPPDDGSTEDEFLIVRTFDPRRHDAGDPDTEKVIVGPGQPGTAVSRTPPVGSDRSIATHPGRYVLAVTLGGEPWTRARVFDLELEFEVAGAAAADPSPTPTATTPSPDPSPIPTAATNPGATAAPDERGGSPSGGPLLPALLGLVAGGAGGAGLRRLRDRGRSAGPPSRRGSEDGQVAPILLMTLVALAAAAMALVQAGRMTTLRADAATAGDAAALAAADEIAEALEGPQGIAFIASGKVPPPVRAAAAAAAAAYTDANDGELRDLVIVEEERRRVRLRVATRTRDALGRPAPDAQAAGHRGEATAAALVELAFLGPTDRGCLTRAEVDAAADRIEDLDRPDRSGLLTCGGADVRNLRPEMHEAVLRLEAVMGDIVRFTSAYRTLEEQVLLWRDREANPYDVAAPGRSWHHTGLAFDASNHGQIAGALSAAPPQHRRLCQPYPITDEVHFSHADYAECGGPMARPPNGALRIETSDPKLIDPAAVGG